MALLELSRLFSTVKPRVTLRFVAFVNEESPFFFPARQESLIYACDARRQRDDIRLMISLDTIGYYDDRPGSQRPWRVGWQASFVLARIFRLSASLRSVSYQALPGVITCHSGAQVFLHSW